MNRNDKIKFFAEIEADENKDLKERIDAGFEKISLVKLNVLELKAKVLNIFKKLMP